MSEGRPGIVRTIIYLLAVIALPTIFLLALRATQPTREQVSFDVRINAAKMILNIAENGNDDLSQLRVMSIGPQLNGTGFEIIYEDDNREVQRRLVNLNTGDIFSPDENGDYHLPDYSQRHGEYE